MSLAVGPAGLRGPAGPPGPPGNSSSSSQPRSAFSVSLGDSTTPSGRTLVFRQVTYNGQSHYSTQTGKFTCQVPGVYQFDFFCVAYRNPGKVQLKRNGVVVTSGVPSYGDGRVTYTGDTVVRLEPGDQVWLEAFRGSSGLLADSFFTGHILFPV